MSKKENNTRYYVHTNPIVNQDNTTVSILKSDDTGRIYEIQFCPTISLSVFLNKEEAKRHHGNHHIFGTIQIKNNEDFDDIWNAIVEALEKRTEVVAGKTVSAMTQLKIGEFE